MHGASAMTALQPVLNLSVRACSILEILDDTNAQWTWCARFASHPKPLSHNPKCQAAALP